MNTEAKDKGQPRVAFTIDGVEYTRDDRKATAAELLTLAGLSPASHDLARVVGNGQVEKGLHDSDTVQLTPGAKFVSVYNGATPVA